MVNKEQGLSTRKYKPVHESPGFSYHFFQLLKDFSRANELGFRLAFRNISAKYRQSIMGILWIFIPPLITSAIWIFLQYSNLIKFKSLEIPYPVFVIYGSVIWQVFVAAVNMPFQSVSQNRNLLVKLNFPRESIFISGFYEVLFNAIITSFIGVIVVVLLGVIPDWHILFYFPVLILLIFAGITIGLFILPFGILFRDVQMGLPFIMQVLMYFSGVIFPATQLEKFSGIIESNPLYVLISVARNFLTSQPSADFLISFSIIAISVILLLIFALVFIRLTMEILVERMGS